jgi:hypothetical protein
VVSELDSVCILQAEEAERRKSTLIHISLVSEELAETGRRRQSIELCGDCCRYAAVKKTVRGL